MATAQTPRSRFINWLVNSANPQLDNDILSQVDLRSTLAMFGKCEGITIYLDKYFNNFNVVSLDKSEFFNFLRNLVQKNKINPYDFTYFVSEKKDKSLKELHRSFPYLKRYEVHDFLELSSEDPEYESLCETLGLIKYKKQKNKKQEKVLKNETISNIRSIVPLEQIKTFNDWKNNFNIRN